MTIARRSHLFPSRTQKLSSLAPMILGGKLPGKVGRCRFFYYFNVRQPFGCLFYCRNPAASLLSESMVSFDPLCGIAARKETMKLAGLCLRVIWTLPVFYYLNLVRSKEKTARRRKNLATRAFLFAQIFLLCRRYCLAISPKYRQKHLAKRRSWMSAIRA